MKNIIIIGFIASLLISCGSPAAVPTIEPTREEPKKAAPVNIIVDTATSTVAATGTYTPIPATFTLTPTEGVKRTLTTPGKISGTGSETIKIVAPLPQSIEYTTRNTLGYFLIFSDGTRSPMTGVFSLTPDNPLTAIQVVGTGAWTITLSNVETPTSTATRKPTTVRSAPTLAVIPTKKPTAVIIPTVFLPPTDVPPPPPAACCKHCTPGKSKACGDSCISIDKTCHQPPGCAC